MAWLNFPDGRSDNGAERSVSGSGARCEFTLTNLNNRGNLNLAGTRVLVTPNIEVNGGYYGSWSRSGSKITLVGKSNKAGFRGPQTGTKVDGYVTAGFVRSWNGIAGRIDWHTVPGAPASISPVATGQSVKVSYGNSSDSGGATITGYRMQYSTNGGTSWSSAVTVSGGSYTFTGLTLGATYIFRVYAVNSAGNSAARQSGSIKIQTAPSSPRDLIATRTGRKVVLDWLGPTTDGGAGVTGYRVQHSADNGATWSTEITTTATTRTFDNLTVGATYKFRIRAYNSVGNSSYVTTGSVTITIPPSAPRNLTAKGVGVNGELAWTAPSSDGGAPIVGYKVRYRPAGGAWSEITVGNITSTVLSNLTPGDYDVEISAQNTPEGYGPALTGVLQIRSGGKVKYPNYLPVELFGRINGVYIGLEKRVKVGGVYVSVE